MDAGLLTLAKRNQVLYSYYKNLTFAGTKPVGQNPPTEADMLHALVGGQRIYFNGLQTPIISPCCRSCMLVPQPILNCSVNDSVVNTLGKFLASCASATAPGVGPTMMARYSYIWLTAVATGWNWIQDTSRITGTKDGWNWDAHGGRITDAVEEFIWMNHVLIYVMQNMWFNNGTVQGVPGFLTDYLIHMESDGLGFTTEEYGQILARVKAKGGWGAWTNAISAWFVAREEDGYKAALAAPSDGELPNGSAVLTVYGQQNIDSFTNKYKWTPLKITSTGPKKNWLTKNWQDVASSLTGVNESDIKATVINAHFKEGGSVDRDDEIDIVKNTTATLTDTQKVIAEFWAGGPGTTTPPGMFVWFWKEYMRIFQPSLDVLFYSGLDLGVHLFEGSRITWGMKRDKAEARPIQEIRRRYKGVELTIWNGTTVYGDFWTPYQEENFVTPPFPDFPSGHSHFSKAFALTMKSWFGESIPQHAPVLFTDLQLLSPVLAASEARTLNSMRMRAGKSEVQPGVVPAVDIVLSWATWEDMATEAGISRYYGGIHAASAHTGSQQAAELMDDAITNKWGIQK